MFEAPQMNPVGPPLTKSSNASEKGKSSILAGVPPTTSGELSIGVEWETSMAAKSDKIMIEHLFMFTV
jgi:hypothetical protein